MAEYQDIEIDFDPTIKKDYLISSMETVANKQGHYLHKCDGQNLVINDGRVCEVPVIRKIYVIKTKNLLAHKHPERITHPIDAMLAYDDISRDFALLHFTIPSKYTDTMEASIVKGCHKSEAMEYLSELAKELEKCGEKNE